MLKRCVTFYSLRAFFFAAGAYKKSLISIRPLHWLYLEQAPTLHRSPINIVGANQSGVGGATLGVEVIISLSQIFQGQKKNSPNDNPGLFSDDPNVLCFILYTFVWLLELHCILIRYFCTNKGLIYYLYWNLE